jgi:hypothetical protein
VLPTITEQTAVWAGTPQNPNPLALAGSVPGASILLAPMKLGALIGDALGLNEGHITDFSPWDNPNGDYFVARKMLLQIFDKQARAYDPVTKRFLNPDGSIALYDARFMDKTGALGPMFGNDTRETWELWVRQHMAAIQFDYDRSKVGADGFSPLGFAIAPPPVIFVDSAAERAKLLDDALASGAPAPTVLVIPTSTPPAIRSTLGLVLRTLEP